MNANIYLDNAATTTARPEVIEVMVPLLAGGYNPSSAHAQGREARAALDDARATVARLLHAAPREVVFTGGGSEADVLAIVGAAKARAADGKHVITTVIEHHAVLHAFDVLEAEGWSVTRLPVNAAGAVEPAAVAAALRPDTTLVSIMFANNEIGTLQPLAEIAALTRASGALLHTTPWRRPVTSTSTPADSASICSRFRPTSSTARRGSASSTCGAGPRSPPRSSAGDKSTGCVRVPRT